MAQTFIRYILTTSLGLLIISGGQLILFVIFSFANFHFADNSRHPVWLGDNSLSFVDKLNSIKGYILGFTFLAFWGLTALFIVCKTIGIFAKRLWVNRIINGLLSFITILIISIGLGYYSSLDNLSILTASLLGLIFGSTILTSQLRTQKNTYA
jgi:hypothetical protein